MLPSTAGSPGALSPVLLPWRLSTDCSCVSSDLPALLSGALTLLKLEKPPVPHSSDSAACDSLCVLWAEPSGWLHAAPSHHGYMQPLKHQCRMFAKEGKFVVLGNSTPSIPLSRGKVGSIVARG